MEIHEATIRLLSQPELQGLPVRHRQDLVSCISVAMIEVAETANPELRINREGMYVAIKNLYEQRFGKIR